MLKLSNIRSLTDFQRNTKEHLSRLKKSGAPEVLTVNGEAELVVQSAEAYQRLLDDAEELKTLRILRKSLEEARRGEGRDAREVLQEIAAKYGVELEK
jgi:PHD/YefM family antitoxin component YafN of YafNO toxin-antitoxin module